MTQTNSFRCSTSYVEGDKTSETYFNTTLGKGDEIAGLPKATEDCRVFQAGTKREGKKVTTSGGRVLCVTALGDSLKMARTRAYEAVESIRFDGMQYRKDIGHRALRDPAGALKKP